MRFFWKSLSVFHSKVVFLSTPFLSSSRRFSIGLLRTVMASKATESCIIWKNISSSITFVWMNYPKTHWRRKSTRQTCVWMRQKCSIPKWFIYTQIKQNIVPVASATRSTCQADRRPSSLSEFVCWVHFASKMCYSLMYEAQRRPSQLCRITSWQIQHDFDWCVSFFRQWWCLFCALAIGVATKKDCTQLRLFQAV